MFRFFCENKFRRVAVKILLKGLVKLIGFWVIRQSYLGCLAHEMLARWKKHGMSISLAGKSVLF